MQIKNTLSYRETLKVGVSAMTKKQKSQNETARQHIAKIGETARRLRSRRWATGRKPLDIAASLKIAERYHQIYGF